MHRATAPFPNIKHASLLFSSAAKQLQFYFTIFIAIPSFLFGEIKKTGKKKKELNESEQVNVRIKIIPGAQTSLMRSNP